MKEIIINGKRRKLRATVGAIRRILKKYNLKEMKSWDTDRILEFAGEALWEFIRPNIFGFKPFFTLKRFLDNVDADEIHNARFPIFSLIYGVEENELEDAEDRERGNASSQ